MAKRRRTTAAAPAATPPPDALLNRQASAPALSGLGEFGGIGPMGGLGPVAGLGGLGFGPGHLYGSGGCADNPLGIPGWGRPYLHTLETYRLALLDPVVHATFTAFFAPVLASSWNYEKTGLIDLPDDLAKKMGDDLRRDFDPLRSAFVRLAAHGINFGRAGGELVWESRNGGYRLADLVPLPVLTPVYQDKCGRFAGLGPPLAGDADAKVDTEQGSTFVGLPAPYKAWLYVYNDEARSLAGRSWLNAVVGPWRDKLDAMQQRQLLCGKVSGRQAIGKGPAGKVPGTDQSWQQFYDAALRTLRDGGSVYIPTLNITIGPGGIEVDKLNAELLKASLFSLEVVDFGNYAGAIEPLTKRVAEANNAIVNAGGFAARVVLEGEFGARSETETKSDAATIVSELINDDIAHQVQPAVDAKIVLNYGEQYRGTMRAVCPPLDTTKQQQRYQLLTLLFQCNNPSLQQEALRVIGGKGIRTVFEDCGMPVVEDFDPDSLTPAVSPTPPGESGPMADPVDPAQGEPDVTAKPDKPGEDPKPA